jgi:DNA-binding CsgD family transcriptional regulator
MDWVLSDTVRTRSSIVVGRDEELRTVDDALSAARAGRGTAVFLVGEGGMGKSRLVDVAADRGYTLGMRLLRGRASSIGPMVPFRSLTEALLSLVRSGEPVDMAQLGPYRPVLARLIPDCGQRGVPPEVSSLVILAEAVLRLTGLAGQGRGCLMALDDLQDADPETLAVVEYLVDNLENQSTVLLSTIRDVDCPAMDLARSCAQRGTGVVIDLGRLGRDDLRELAGSCLDVAPRAIPDAAVDLLWASSVGNPFLVEEALGGMIDSGLLVSGPGGWRMVEHPRSEVPATFSRSVARRVGLLGPQARELLSVAAVLGRRFPLAVVRVVTGMGDRDLLSNLHGDLAAQLVKPDDQTPDWYAFQHQLIREAMLTLLAGDERAELARRIADAVELVHPGLPGEWCQVSAALRMDAGDRPAAGRLFAEAGRRALGQGAANSAVALLDRAWELLAGVDAATRAEVLAALLHALAEAGLVERALASVGTLDEIGGLDRHRRAQLHTRLAWAAAVAGRSSPGLRQVEMARSLLGPDAAAEDLAPVDVVAAHLALDLPGPERLSVAETMARRAAGVAEAAPLPVVACQAWQLLGALTRPRDLDEATACLERARTIAVQHELPIWQIHTLVRLGEDDALRHADLDRLYQARTQASLVGAVTARYQAEAGIALHTILRGDFPVAGTTIDLVLGATTRLKLLETVQYVLLLRAILAGHQGRRAEMDQALAEFGNWQGNAQPQYTPRVFGLARSVCSLLEENRDRALQEQARALSAEENNPTVMHLTGRYGLQLLLGALSGATDWTAYRRVTDRPASRLRWDRQFALFARAVLAGRSGRPDEAVAAVTEAVRVGAPYRMGVHLGLRLVGEAALVDGWGQPVEWLRSAEEYFHRAQVPAVASACRALLRRTGVRVAQRRTGSEDIPAALRSAGLTVREYEVLKLLADRLGNREIADRLHLSVRTVEKHVSNLLTKVGLPNRIALSAFASERRARSSDVS